MAAKKELPELTIKKQLEQKKPASGYLLYGEDGTRVAACTQTVKKYALQTGEDESTAWTAWDMSENSFASLMAELRTVSFFGGYRFVYMFNFSAGGDRAGGLKLEEKQQEELLKYLDKPSPDVTLVMRVSKIDGRIKFWKDVKTKTEVLCFDASNDQKTMMVDMAIKDSGLTFDYESKEWMRERFTSSISSLTQEVEKLITFMGSEKAVTINQIESCMTAPKIENIWTLTRAVAGGNLQLALEAIRSLKNQGESYVMILPMIARQFRFILICKDGKKKGLQQSEIASRCGVRSEYAIRDHMGQSRLFTTRRLVTILDRLHKADVTMRASGLNPWSILEAEVTLLVSSGGK